MNNSVIVILGMHRSGTSAMAGVLGQLGVDAGSKLMSPCKDVNPKGFWEHDAVVQIHERLLKALKSSWDDLEPLPDGWWKSATCRPYKEMLLDTIRRDFSESSKWLLKDPRLCRLLPIWLDIFGCSPHFVIPLRDPIEVAGSLQRRDKIFVERACLIWARHMLEAEKWSRGFPRTIISYSSLLDDWRSVVQKISSDLNIPLGLGDDSLQSVIDDFLDPSLRHHVQKEQAEYCCSPSISLAEEIFNRLEIGEFPGADQMSGLDVKLESLVSQVKPWDKELRKVQLLERAVYNLNDQIEGHEGELKRIKATVSWKITKPLRVLARFRRLPYALAQLSLNFRIPPVLVRKIFDLHRRVGVKGVIGEAYRYVRNTIAYQRWIKAYDTYTEADYSVMRDKSAMLEYQPLISIIMPTYNTPERWLYQAIESVRSQVYSNWELCIADDASSLSSVRTILEEYMRIDSRIRVVFRPDTGHISAAANSALALAGGDYIALLDHDDELACHALYAVATLLNEKRDTDLVYSDEDKIDHKGRRYDPLFKSDWNPDLFTAQNLVSHLGVFRTRIVRDVGGFRVGFEGAQDWDLALRVSEKIPGSHICHIPRVLYHWRAISGSTAIGNSEKPYVRNAAHLALKEHLDRVNAKGDVVSVGQSFYRVRYHVPSPLPLVSIIIPTKNGLQLLRRCIESVLSKTSYGQYEIIIVDNQSDDPETIQYLMELKKSGVATVLEYDFPFNYSAINNFAVKEARGEYLCMMNNDIEVISEDWLNEMTSHAARPEIGAVGAMLYYPNDVIQHAGVLIGMGGVAGHLYCGYPRGVSGYMTRAQLVQNMSAVTAACLVVRKSVYMEVGGLDESNLPIAFNDVDFCLRLIEQGYRNLWTPFAELYHHESATRGRDDVGEKRDRFQAEIRYMRSRWGHALQSDPAYSPNLTLSQSWPYIASRPRVHGVC